MATKQIVLKKTSTAREEHPEQRSQSKQKVVGAAAAMAERRKPGALTTSARGAWPDSADKTTLLTTDPTLENAAASAKNSVGAAALQPINKHQVVRLKEIKHDQAIDQPVEINTHPQDVPESPRGHQCVLKRKTQRFRLLDRDQPDPGLQPQGQENQDQRDLLAVLPAAARLAASIPL
jgi:hypothetical protein